MTIRPTSGTARFTPSVFCLGWFGVWLITLVTNPAQGAPTFTETAAPLNGFYDSAAAWGDVDGDGDLDLAVLGSTGFQTRATTLLRNDNGVFLHTDNLFQPASNGGLAWGDYDGDGDLDLALCGTTGFNQAATVIYRNDAGTFTDIHAGLSGVGNSDIGWADVDSDGDLDVMVIGGSEHAPVAQLYRNTNGQFVAVASGVQGIMNGSLAWGDYDHDGDPDLLTTGIIAGTSGQATADRFVTHLYRNDSGTLTMVDTNIVGVAYGNATWGDYDVDGDLDIALTGNTGHGYTSRVYRNDNGQFVDVNAELPGTIQGSVSWGDCDSDGDLDLFLTGRTDGAPDYQLKAALVINDRGTFVAASNSLPGVHYGVGVWGDYDNDGYADLLLAGTSATAPAMVTVFHNDGVGLSGIPAGQFADADVRATAVADRVAVEMAERTQALEFAQQNGIEVRGVTVDNQTFELDSVTERGPIFLVTSNDNAAVSTAVDRVRNHAPYNVNGNGHVVGVWDGGSVLSTHQEFQSPSGSRISVRDGAASHYHATHVGGTIAGSGAVARALGMAPEATIASYDWNSDESEMTAAAASTANSSDHIYVSNHSYGFIEGWYTPNGQTWYWLGHYASGEREDRSFGNYSTQAQLWDTITHSAPYYLPFKSAGNDRNDNPSFSDGDVFYRYNSTWQLVADTYASGVSPAGDGEANGGFDTISGAGISKNVMTVGAVTDAVASGERSLSATAMTSFSGWGPADDGRIKPDIVANGYNLYSAHNASTTAYAGMSGTSMSAPNASGTAILIQEYYHNQTGVYMRASSLKALLIHTADDLGNDGPDYTFGWGLINAEAAATLIDTAAGLPDDIPGIEHDTLANSQTHTYTFGWDGVNPIRITLCWTDPAHNAISGLDSPLRALVNDLDLRLTGPDDDIHQPWVLDVTQPSSPATHGDNVVDNVEQVLIATPTAVGNYTITVQHKGTLALPQAYSLVVTGQAALAGPLVVNPIADQNIDDNAPYTFTVPADTFSDPDNADLAYTAYLNVNDDLPIWLNFNRETQTFTGNPTYGDAGLYDIRVHATNPDDLTGIDTFTLTVHHVNRPPTISNIDNVVINENHATSAIAFSVDDVETPADQLSVVVTSSNVALVASDNIVINGDGTERSVVLTPIADTHGVAQITVTVSDGTDSASTTFDLDVLEYTAPRNANRSTIVGTANIGGEILILLDADDYDSWEVVYGESIVALSGDISQYTLDGIRADVTTVTVRALGLDTFGVSQTDQVTMAIPFTEATISSLTQTPDSVTSPVAYGSDIMIHVETRNCTAVSIDSTAMTPLYDPETAYANVWTLDHQALDTESLAVYVTTPGTTQTRNQVGIVEIMLQSGTTPINNATAIGNAVLGSDMDIALNGQHQFGWQVAYRGQTTTVSGDATSHRIPVIDAAAPTVSVIANGIDESGHRVDVERELEIAFTAATLTGLDPDTEQTPTTVPQGTAVPLTVYTTGASAVTVGGDAMEPEFPAGTTNINTWTYVHNATRSTILPVVITTPGTTPTSTTTGNFTINVYGPPPTNVDRSTVDGLAEIGGVVPITLDADNYTAFEVVYNGQTFEADASHQRGLTDNDASAVIAGEQVHAQNFSGIAFDAFDTVVADDFIVPLNETWSIAEIRIGGTGADAPITAVDIGFHAADNGALPGTTLAEFLEITATDDGSGTLTVTLDKPVTLATGRYWLSIAGVLDFYDAGQWFVRTRVHSVGDSYAWRNPGSGWRVSDTPGWLSGDQALGTPERDLDIALTGRSRFLLTNIVADAPTVLIRALGYDFDGTAVTDDVELPLIFVAATADNYVQTPESRPNGIAYDTEMVLAVDTVGASAVTVGDVPMIPANDPNIHKQNTWTLTHTAQATESLLVQITTPGNPVTVDNDGAFDIVLFGPAPDNVERSWIDGPATIGGAVDVHLDADHEESWQVVYNGHVYDIAGHTDTFVLNTVASAAVVVIRALGHDEYGRPASDEITQTLPFAAAQCAELAQSPDSQPDGVAYGEPIQLTVTTQGAAAVTVGGIPMTPSSDPLQAEHNTWSLTYSATADTTLPVVLTTPGNPSTLSTCGNVTISIAGPRITSPADIGGNVTIVLPTGTGVTWAITYNNTTTIVPENIATFELQGVLATHPTVDLTLRRDTGGELVTDDVTLPILFTPATASAFVQTPNSIPDGVPESTEISLSLTTAGASAVALDGQAMVPGMDPTTHHHNTWTASHVATTNTELIVEVTTPGIAPTSEEVGSFEIRIADRVPTLAVNNGLIVFCPQATVITGQHLQVIDPAADPVDTVYTLATLPVNGLLTRQGRTLDTGDQFTQDDINKRHIHYVYNGAVAMTDSFAFTLGYTSEDTLVESTFAITIASTHRPHFVERTDTSNPLYGHATGTTTHPVFVDIDADGDMDCFVGNSDARNHFFENTGTRSNPIYIAMADDAHPFADILDEKYTAPAFVDIDGDGDLDCFVGDKNGQNDFYRNEGTALTPHFVMPQNRNNPLLGLNTGQLSPPIFADLDEDGDFDVFIGRQKGDIEFFENIGTSSAPEFTQKTGDNNPFESLDFGDGISPTFAQLVCGPGSDCFLGTDFGTILYLANMSTGEELVFTRADGTANPLDHVAVSGHSAPHFVDIDGDGDLDCFVGNDSTTVRYFENVPGNSAPVDLNLVPATITENAPIDSAIGTLTATDDNTDDTHTFTLVTGDGDDHNHHFAINGTTLVTASMLDFESRSDYAVRVRATDSEGEVIEKPLTVFVSDMAEAPVFTTLPRFTVEDTATDGHVLGAIAAADDDNDQLAFSILDGNTGDAFALDSHSGQLTVVTASEINYVHTSRYFLTLGVTDGTHLTTGSVVVDVTSGNMHQPVIDDQTFSVSEHATNGTTVGLVAAADGDDDTLHFSIVDGDPQGTFTITANTGLLTVADDTRLDFDTTTDYALTIRVDDGRYDATAAVTVNVTTDNANPPTADPQAFWIAEDATPNAYVGTVVAQDVDGSELNFEIVDGNDNNTFVINAESGVIQLIGALNFELKTTYELDVTISDDRYTATTLVTVHVTDVNDIAPSIDNALWLISEQTQGNTVIGALSANDSDSSHLTFAIVGGNEHGSFVIEPLTGTVRTAADTTLDYNVYPEYTLTINVTDGELDDTGQLTIQIVTTPIANTPQSFTVFEDAGTDTWIGTVNVSDDDNDELEFTIVDGNSDGTFAINETTGELRVADTTSLDYETTPAYTLEVAIRDRTHTVVIEVMIDVIDVNDTAPVAGQLEFTVSESAPLGTVVGDITASDAENNQLTYTVIDADPLFPQAFALNGSVISVTDSSSLDYETIQHVRLTIAISDGLNSVDADVTITILDDDDTAPTIIDHHLIVLEIAPNGTLVGNIEATDPDTDALAFSILNGNIFGVFALSADGRLTVADNTTLDATVTPQYSLTVEVSDSERTARSSVTISVRPALSGNALTIPDMTAIEDELFTYQLPQVVHAGVRVDVAAIQLPSWLALTEVDGGVMALSGIPLNADVGAHAVTLQFSDGWQAVTVNFTITVLNVNDAPQILINRTLRVTEGATRPVTDDVLQVVDPDSPPTTLNFTVISGPAHGELRLNGGLLGNGSAFTQANIDRAEVSYSHTESFIGGEALTDTIVFTVSDGDGGTIPETVFYIQIDPPFLIVDGGDSKPAFADIDDDGHLDLIVGTGDGTLRFYHNDAVDSARVFQPRDGDDNPFDTIAVAAFSAPALIDIDDDGDLDCVVGGYTGALAYYLNHGNPLVPLFVDGPPALFGDFNVDYFSTPAFSDIDADGDYDCFVGSYGGGIAFLENVGDAANPAFVWREDESNPLHGVDVGDHSSPAFVDYDEDGDIDCFVGRRDGTIAFYRNDGTRNTAIFVAAVGNDNPYNGVDVGDFSSPVFVDHDADGKLNFFVGAADHISEVESTPANATPTDIHFTAVETDSSPPVGARIGTFSVVDADSADLHTFKLVDGSGDDDNALFRIDGTALRTTTHIVIDRQREYHIRVEVSDAISAPLSKSITIVIGSDEVTVTVRLVPGWQLVAFPGEMDDNTVSTRFASPAVQAVWGFDAGRVRMFKPTQIEPNQGYWVFASAAVALPPITCRRTSLLLDLPHGWNVIGVSEDMPFERLGPDIRHGYEWDARRARYRLLSDDRTLVIGQGYWVYRE